MNETVKETGNWFYLQRPRFSDGPAVTVGNFGNKYGVVAPLRSRSLAESQL